MPESTTISSTNASFPKYLDFQQLRAEGIRHCLDLGHALWTDFNLHDPGLTIFEAVCYALTDLGFRTNLPIADLLAQSPEQNQDAKANPDAAVQGKPFDDNFFTADEILTCNPVTLFDLRKLIINVSGVRNAYVRRADDAEVPIYLNEKTAELQYKPETELKVTPDGLYEVLLELEEPPEPTTKEASAESAHNIKDNVKKVLHQHRNLCEDFLDVKVMGEESVALCVDVEIQGSADPADVLLDMYRALEEFLSPELTFYTLEQMLAKGKSMEEIYAGRPMSPPPGRLKDCPELQNKGFIDAEQLQKSRRRSVLHASDLYQVIMNVDGVLAVRDLTMVNYIGEVHQTEGEKWSLPLTKNHHQRFDLKRSKIVFYKEQIPLVVGDEQEQAVLTSFRQEKNASAKAPLEPHQLDRPVPEGRFRPDLAKHRSVVHEFPLAYGIGEGGVPKTATVLRKAQVRQLRAYLLFYDQVLANYLAQLANLRELFSMRSDHSDHRLAGKNRTYFTQRLSDIPNIQDLLRNYDCEGGKNDPATPDDDTDYLDFVAESSDEYFKRRNRFLDHLLARFAESFTDYVLLMFDVNGKQNDEQSIIRNKTEFLTSYPDISRNRGKGFNYFAENAWQTDNVSGLERRVRRLLGIERGKCHPEPPDESTPRRIMLGHADVIEVDRGWFWSVEIPASEGEATTIDGHKGYETKEDAEAGLNAFRELARDEKNYRRLDYPGYRHFGLGVREKAAEGECEKRPPMLAESQNLFLPEELAAAIEKLSAHIAGLPDDFSGTTIQLEDGLHFFVVALDVVADLGSVTFRSSRGYPTSDAAEEAAQEFREQAAKTAEYDPLPVAGFTHYGFAVVDQEQQIVADVGRRWADRETRDLQLFRLIQLAIGGQVECELFQESKRFYFQLLGGEETPVLEGDRGFHAEAEAEAAFQALLPIAQEPESFVPVDAPDGFRFEVHGPDGKLADCVVTYPSAAEREQAIDSLIANIVAGQATSHIYPEGAYRFEIHDAENVPLLSGTQVHRSEAWALEHGRRAVAFARDRTRLHRTEDGLGACLYGIALVDGENQIIARHPRHYPSKEKRDAACQRIYAVVLNRETLPDAIGRSYKFQLKDHQGKTLVASERSFDRQSEAAAAFPEMLELANDQTRYERVPIEGKFTFRLVNEKGEEIARHPEQSTTVQQCDASIAETLFFVQSRGVPHEIVESDPGQFTFSVQDFDHEEILRGQQTKDTEACVRNLIVDAVRRGSDADSYKNEPDGEGGLFGFLLLDGNGEPLAEHPVQFETPVERDTQLAACIEFLQQLAIDPAFAVDGYFYQVADVNDRMLLRSVGTWQDKSKAEAQWRTFLPLAVSDANYRREYDQCEYTFSVVDPQSPADAPAWHPFKYKLPQERDDQIQLTLDLLREQSLKHHARGAPEGHYFRLVGDGNTLASASRYVSSSEAASACTRLFPRLTSPDAYAIEQQADGLHLVLSDDSGEVRAESAAGEQPALDAMRDALIELASQATPLPGHVEKSQAVYRSVLKDPEGVPVLFGTLREGGESKIVSRAAGFATAESRDQALETAWKFFRDAPDPEPLVVEIDGEFFFRFEITDDLTLHSFARYPSAFRARQAGRALGQLNFDEPTGFLRREDDNSFGFDLVDSLAAEWERCHRLVERAQDDNNFRRITAAEWCQHGFELIGANGEVLARHPTIFDSAEDRDSYIEMIRCLVNTEGLHLVEHNLLRPKKQPLRDAPDGGEELLDALLPVGEGCRDDTGKLCPVRADVYSFRVTIVVPYWPRRFRKIDFRRFVERTIRIETPAHIYARICWVDARQMREFEQAFENWIRTLNFPPESSERSDAQRSLVSILMNLKNVYQTARLGQSGMILDQTILGTGGPDDDADNP